MFDSNEDGCISKDELRQAFTGGHLITENEKEDEKLWEQIMADVDKNND